MSTYDLVKLMIKTMINQPLSAKDDIANNNMTIVDVVRYYQLGSIIEPITQVFGGCCHRSFKATTDKGTFVIKKQSPSVVEFLGGRQQLLQQLKLMDYFIAQDIPLQPILYSNYYWQILPWIEGDISKAKEPSQQQLTTIAKLVAKLHQIKVKANHLPLFPSPWHLLSATDWHYSFQKANHPYEPEVIIWQKRYYDSQYHQPSVLSHGDLNPTNIIWQNSQIQVIDWESAGLVNPDAEIINTALSWSNFASPPHGHEHFSHFISQYQKHRQIPLIFSKASIYRALGYWLAWLKFCLLRLSGHLPAIIAQEKNHHQYRQSTTKTINKIKWLLANKATILNLTKSN